MSVAVIVFQAIYRLGHPNNDLIACYQKRPHKMSQNDCFLILKQYHWYVVACVYD